MTVLTKEFVEPKQRSEWINEVQRWMYFFLQTDTIWHDRSTVARPN